MKRLKTRAFVRWTSLSVIASGIVGIYLSINAFQNPYAQYSEVNFVMQNWGTVFIAGMLLLAYYLKNLQGGIYWFFWLQLKLTELDERQARVRQQVFERAYVYMIFILIFFSIYATDVLGDYAPDARSSIAVRALAVATIFVISLPSILASWRNDS